jgi:hypothetical protein
MAGRVEEKGEGFTFHLVLSLGVFGMVLIDLITTCMFKKNQMNILGGVVFCW